MTFSPLMVDKCKKPLLSVAPMRYPLLLPPSLSTRRVHQPTPEGHTGVSVSWPNRATFPTCPWCPWDLLPFLHFLTWVPPTATKSHNSGN